MTHAMQVVADVAQVVFVAIAFVVGAALGGITMLALWVLLIVGSASRTARKRRERLAWKPTTSRIENEEVQYVKVRGQDHRVDEFDIPGKSRPH